MLGTWIKDENELTVESWLGVEEGWLEERYWLGMLRIWIESELTVVYRIC